MTPTSTHPMTPTIAQIETVKVIFHAMKVAANAPIGHPKFVGAFGPSGVGKTTAAAYTAAHLKCGFVEIRSVMRAKDLITAVAMQVGLKDLRGTTYGILQKVLAQLKLTRQNLIIDECDRALKHDTLVEVLRDLVDGSPAAIMLIGEESFPEKLETVSVRTHNRVLNWIQARPLTGDDSMIIRDVICQTGTFIEDDLANYFAYHIKGITRRFIVNLKDARDVAEEHGIEKLDLKTWQSFNRPINNGRFDRVLANDGR